MVTVAYCSDLHLDNFRFFNGHAYPPIVNTKDNPADILILAGDLYEYKYMNDHKTFIQTLADSYKYVLIVEGNHEFYESDIDDKPSFTYPENVILLKNETFIYEGIVFYGGTGRMTVDNRKKNERSRTGNPYSSHVKAGKYAGTVYNFKRKSRIRKSLTKLSILLEFIHKYIFLNFVSFYNGLNSNAMGRLSYTSSA
jgi:predicted MPP superfamily phosphohydrolase